MSEDPDGPLVARARRGDERAFAQLVERHGDRLFTLAARELGSAADAADAVQETLLRAWLALPRFRGASLFRTWLYRICLNTIFDQRTKRRAEPAELSPQLADPRDQLLEHELSGALQAALATLAEEFRIAVVLADLLGCPYSEIAELTSVAEGTVKSRIFRARVELGRLLEAEGTERGLEESKE